MKESTVTHIWSIETGRNALKKMVKILETETFSEIIAGLDDYSVNK
jgi:hypothetical protein